MRSTMTGSAITNSISSPTAVSTLSRCEVRCSGIPQPLRASISLLAWISTSVDRLALLATGVIAGSSSPVPFPASGFGGHFSGPSITPSYSPFHLLGVMAKSHIYQQDDSNHNPITSHNPYSPGPPREMFFACRNLAFFPLLESSKGF